MHNYPHLHLHGFRVRSQDSFVAKGPNANAPARIFILGLLGEAVSGLLSACGAVEVVNTIKYQYITHIASN